MARKKRKKIHKEYDQYIPIEGREKVIGTRKYQVINGDWVDITPRPIKGMMVEKSGATCYECEKIVNKTYLKKGLPGKYCWDCWNKVNSPELNNYQLMRKNHGHK
jgi:hypothetical protein